MSEEFPMDALPQAAREYVFDLCSRNRSAYEMAAPALLSMAGFTALKRVNLRVGDNVVFSNAYTATVGNAGSGKGCIKEPLRAIKEVEKIRIDRFMKTDRPKLAANISYLRSQVARFEKDLAKCEDDEQREVLLGFLANNIGLLEAAEEEYSHYHQLTVGDSTTAAMLDTLARNDNDERILCACGEARQVIDNILGAQNGGRGTEENLILKLYSGDGHRQDRRGDQIKIDLESPRGSYALLVQPDKASELFNNEKLKDCGLRSRFLVSTASRKQSTWAVFKKVTPVGESGRTPEGDWWFRFVNNMFSFYHFNPTIYETQMSPEADAVAADFYNKIELQLADKTLSDFEDYAVRWSENFLKIMLILHLLEHSTKSHEKEISGETAVGARKIMNFFIHHCRLMSGEESAEAAEKKWLRLRELFASSHKGKTPGQISPRDLVIAKVENDSNAATAWLMRLTALGKLKLIPAEGRKKERWELNKD